MRQPKHSSLHSLIIPLTSLMGNNNSWVGCFGFVQNMHFWGCFRFWQQNNLRHLSRTLICLNQKYPANTWLFKIENMTMLWNNKSLLWLFYLSFPKPSFQVVSWFFFSDKIIGNIVQLLHWHWRLMNKENWKKYTTLQTLLKYYKSLIAKKFWEIMRFFSNYFSI